MSGADLPEPPEPVAQGIQGTAAKQYSALALEEALELWRGGYKQTRRPDLPEVWRRDYELASTAVELVGLRDCHTMQDLLRCYYDRERQLEPVIRGAVHAAAEEDRLLNWGLVEDAAYWRRYCALIRRAVAEPEE